MRLNLTDGKSRFTFIISSTVDAADWNRVVKAKKPVSTAMDVIKERVGAEVFSGLYPVQGVVLEGLPT